MNSITKIFPRRSRSTTHNTRLTDGLRVYEIVRQLHMQNYGLLGGILYVRLVRVLSGGVDPEAIKKTCPSGLCDSKQIISTGECFRMGDLALAMCTVVTDN